MHSLRPSNSNLIIFLVDGAQEQNEDPKKHVVRYLQTLFVWFKASLHVLQSLSHYGRQLQVFQVQAGPPLLIVTQDSITAFQNAYA